MSFLTHLTVKRTKEIVFFYTKSDNIVLLFSVRPISTASDDDVIVTSPMDTTLPMSCNTVSYPEVTSYRWYNMNEEIVGMTSQVYNLDIDDDSDYSTYTCYATNTVGTSEAIPFIVLPGLGPDVVVAMGVGPTDWEILAILLGMLFLLLLILLIILCCCLGKYQLIVLYCCLCKYQLIALYQLIVY